MNKKAEILVAPKSVAEMERLVVAGADAFVVGDTRFGLITRESFEKDNLEEAVYFSCARGKNIYLQIDAIFPNALLVELEIYLKKIKYLPFAGIRVADLGAYMLVREIMPKMPVQLVDAMMLTNHETVNYWANKGITRGRLAHELTLDEVLEIKNHAACEIEVLIQGVPLMFTSRRKLVDNYLDFHRTFGKNVTIAEDGNFLFDKERDLYYPIVQNEHGTHIYGGNDVCMVDNLAELLDAQIDALYIESFTYQTEELVKVVQLYKMAVELVAVDPEKYSRIGRALYAEVEKLQAGNRRTDRGFYYKPTIYKNQSR